MRKFGGMLIGIAALCLIWFNLEQTIQMDLNTGDERTLIRFFGATLHTSESRSAEGREFMPGGSRMWEPRTRGRLWTRGIHTRYMRCKVNYRQAFLLAEISELDDADRLALNTLLRDASIECQSFWMPWKEWRGLSLVELEGDCSMNGTVLWIDPYNNIEPDQILQMLGLRPDLEPNILDQEYAIGTGRSYCWMLCNSSTEDLKDDVFISISDPDAVWLAESVFAQYDLNQQVTDTGGMYIAKTEDCSIYAKPVLTDEQEPALLVVLTEVEHSAE